MSKKLLFIFALVAACMVGQAQITLSSSDWPTASTTGEIYWAQNDSLNTINDSVDLGMAGASGSYDFTKIGPAIMDTTNLGFMDASSSMWGSNHPGAELTWLADQSVDDSLGDTVVYMHQFLDSDGSHLIAQGITIIIDTMGLFMQMPSGNYDTVHINMTKADTMVSAVDTFGRMNTTAWEWETQLGSLFHKEYASVDREVDGWGNLHGPMGSTPCLRLKVTEWKTQVDSISGDSAASMEMDTANYYVYWANAQGWEICRAEMSPDWNDTWQIRMLNFTPVSIGTYEESDFTLFPNPNNGQFRIRMEKNIGEAGTWKIYNTYGQTLATQQMAPGTRELEMNLENLGFGVYYAVFQDGEGQNMAVKRFVIQR